MTPLFSADGKARLDTFVRPGVLCAFDFDGTLAPIVAQPERAHLPPAIRARLLQLQELAEVAILTGRALDDIAARLDFTPDYLIGNHGLEGLPGSSERRAWFVELCDGWRAVVRAALAEPGRLDPAIGFEDKQISLSLHYRHVQDAPETEAALATLFSTLTPAPRIIAGKCVYNLLPQAAGDKGTAFDQLMLLSAAPAALYVGDDVTDEDVFRLTRPDLLSIRVGETRNSAAPYFLRGHDDMLHLLDTLIARLAAAPRP